MVAICRKIYGTRGRPLEPISHHVNRFDSPGFPVVIGMSTILVVQVHLQSDFYFSQWLVPLTVFFDPRAMFLGASVLIH